MQDDCQDTPYTGHAPDASPLGPLVTQAVQVADPHGVGPATAAPAYPPVANAAPESRPTGAQPGTQTDAQYGAQTDAQTVALPTGDAPIAQSAASQQALLRTVYEENLTAVYRFIYGKVGAREEAEDLTSQVFMKALRGLDRARDPQSIQNWLFQVARTTVADHWRAYYRLPSRSLDDLLDAGWEGPSEGARPYPGGAHDDDSDDATEADTPAADEVDASVAALMTSANAGDGEGVEGRAHRILAQLPPRYRAVLTYRFLLNYSLKETAAQMQLTEANVKVLQFRALKKASQMEFPA